MADLTITAANVQWVDGSKGIANAAATITAGDVLRLDANGDVILASDDTAANAAAIGFALNNGSTGQPIQYQATGNLDLGATLEIGKPYVLSTSGAVAPVDDIAGGEFITVLGIATAADNFKMGICVSGVAAAGAVI